MEILNELLNNTVFMAAATGWLVAQILKTIIYTFLNRKFDPERLVMYDARGVRRETGIQAQVLNEMIAFWEKMGQPLSYEEKLKEFVGHTPIQVFAGALLGILIAVIYCTAL